jgi:hypothetical protein
MRIVTCLQISQNFEKIEELLLSVTDFGQTKTHTAEPTVPEPTSFEDEISTKRLKIYTSPGIDQIPTELIQVGGSTLHSVIHKLINFIWNKAELQQQWKESITVPVYKRAIKLTVVIK